jgi:ferrous iron transport protein A
MKIKDLAVGSSGRVIGYSTQDRAYREKLLRMGLVRGAEFKFTRIAPLGDPIEICIHGFKLSLRKDEANALEVESA